MEELSSLLEEIKKRVLPSSFSRRTSLINDIKSIQKKTVILGRNYFSLIYSIFWKNSEHKKFSHSDMMGNILLEENSEIPSIDPLPAQILINLLHSLFQQPRPFVHALIDSNIPETEACRFAYTTFPAIFNYFMSSEMYEAGSLFVLDLVTSPAPSFLIKQIVTAFMFSSYSFIDVLWCSFARRYENYGFPDEDIVHRLIVESIASTLPLLSSSLYFILRELYKNNPSLLYEILFSCFLHNTFLSWAMRSPMGLSLNSLNVVTNYFENQKNPNTTKAQEIIQIFLVNTNERVNSTPSYIPETNLSCEIMIFSHRDISVICQLFQSISNNILMFDDMKEFGDLFGTKSYEPFQITYFHLQPSNHFNMMKEKFSNTLFQIPKIDTSLFIKDSILEKLYQQYLNNLNKGSSVNNLYFQTERFIKYKTIKEIEFLLEASSVQDEMILLKMAYNNIQSFSLSIEGLFHQLLGWYLKHVIVNLMNIEFIHYQDIEILTEQIIQHHESFRIPVFIELLNFIDVDKYVVDKELIEKILKTVILSKTESEDIMKQSRTITGLPIMLTNRLILKPGQFFVIMNFIIEIINKMSNEEDQSNNHKISRSSMMKFVLKLSNCERNIIHFLFFEKIVFRSSFIRFLPRNIVNNFNFFFQSMWDLLKDNETLLENIISIELVME